MAIGALTGQELNCLKDDKNHHVVSFDCPKTSRLIKSYAQVCEKFNIIVIDRAFRAI